MQSRRARPGASVAVAAALCLLAGCGDVKSRDDGSGSESDAGSEDDGTEDDSTDDDGTGDDGTDDGTEDAGSEDAGSGDNGELTIFNESDFVIEAVFVAETGSEYGPNLAPPGGLRPGDAQGIVLGCQLYDILLIDEDKVECEVVGLDVCDNEDNLVFENDDCFVAE
jgi:hypothetical protein